MSKPKKKFSRREILAIAAAAGGLAVSGDNCSTAAQTTSGPVFTPSVILGPFYPQVKPTEQDRDLTVISGRKAKAVGTPLYLTGQVRTLAGQPVSGAKVTVWQANSYGRYTHKSDPNPAPLDPNFQGFATQITDDKGRYHLKTIKPGAYPAPVVGMRAPHVHFEIEAEFDRLITQMFFPGEPLNGQDAFYQFLKAPQREAVLAKPAALPAGSEPGALAFIWDVVLISG
jgi:protocatechuate 3,4-dioxygenase beta subunit